MIKIICVGKIKEIYFKEAIDEYLKRLSKYTNIKIIEVLESNTLDIKKDIEKEGEYIDKHIDTKDYLIALDIEGKSFSSKELASMIDKEFINHSNITFIIGGSNGLDSRIKEKVNLRLSFSKLTFPHQLFRVILLEQIYRSYKINNNENYHK